MAAEPPRGRCILGRPKPRASAKQLDRAFGAVLSPGAAGDGARPGPTEARLTMDVSALVASFKGSLETAVAHERPYPHWFLRDIFPAAVADALAELPFPVPDLHGISGKRDLHNASRQYFDRENMERYSVCAALSEVFQDPEIVATLQDSLGPPLEGTYVRIEYAQDIDGFWLEPHTDLGVKKFTMLYYLSTEAGHDGLGTDIYADPATPVGRSPFARNAAMIFIPSATSWHGFEKRTIPGIRKSIIINYVGPEWQAREQLAFPDEPVRAI
jgi:hypothetical protein